MRNTITARVCLFLLVPSLFLAAGCRTIDFTAPLQGKYVKAALAVKDFEVISMVSTSSTETHSAGPLGFVKTVEGSKVTYSDLLQEAAIIDADDIIDIRIDKNAAKPRTFAEWLTGWERTYTYTGKAVAIKYIDNNPAEVEEVEVEIEEVEEVELDFFFR